MSRERTRRPGPETPLRDPVDRQFEDGFQELRRIASSLKRRDGSVTINPTALVHEAWLRLRRSPDVGALPPAHFRATAARVMRRVLTDAARARAAQKRALPAGAVMVTLDHAAEQASVEADLIHLNQALEELARLEPRQAAVLEGRYFGGLTTAELATLLNVSLSTIERDFRVAKAFLRKYLRPMQH